MYVCICNQVTENDIRQAVVDGHQSLRQLRKQLGVAGNCGSCADMAKSLLQDTLQDMAAVDSSLYYLA